MQLTSLHITRRIWNHFGRSRMVRITVTLHDCHCHNTHPTIWLTLVNPEMVSPALRHCPLRLCVRMHGYSFHSWVYINVCGWASWSASQVGRHIKYRGRTTYWYSVKSGKVVKDRREGNEDEDTKRRRGKKGGMGEDRVGRLYLDICAGVFPEFLVTPLLKGWVCLLSQGRFEEPVRPWIQCICNR